LRRRPAGVDPCGRWAAVGSAHEVEVFLRCWPSPPYSKQSWRTSRRSAHPPGGGAPDPASFTLTRPMTATPTGRACGDAPLDLAQAAKERDDVYRAIRATRKRANAAQVVASWIQLMVK
jgi:hypothetical protein